MIKPGIKQIGGNFRTRKLLDNYTPKHEFFLSMFLGAGWYELNKPRCQYELFNDKNSDIINYFEVMTFHPKEFDEKKKGLFGLVSQQVYNDIVDSKLEPKDDIERAVFFYYINKLSFGSEGNSYRGVTLPTSCKKDSVAKVKAHYRGIIPRGVRKKSYKGINPKVSRPYTNNDCGLLTPIDPGAIRRLRYVNITNYDFRKAYKLFCRAFFKRKGLTQECFVYADPPFPGTEIYYGNDFLPDDHYDLIEMVQETPFNCMLSIGGKCGFYIDSLKEAWWKIKEIEVQYSTNAQNPHKSREYICMNYDIKKLSKMVMDNQPSIMDYMGGLI